MNTGIVQNGTGSQINLPRSKNAAVYMEGYIYPDSSSKHQSVATTVSQLKNSGFTAAMLCQFHIYLNGDIHFNDAKIISNGNYIGAPAWPDLINGIMVESSIKKIGASIGPAFKPIFDIYVKNNNSFENTPIKSNFTELLKQFPSISFIDLDCEDDYVQPKAFNAFCAMLIEIGFSLTFCPYTEISFWVSALEYVETNYPGKVLWWNLQCYSGGYGNRDLAYFDQWSKAISIALPHFSTDRFILAGDSTSDTPSEVEAMMKDLSASASFGGGFIWTFDHIIEANSKNPIPQEQAYSNAIIATIDPKRMI